MNGCPRLFLFLSVRKAIKARQVNSIGIHIESQCDVIKTPPVDRIECRYKRINKSFRELLRELWKLNFAIQTLEICPLS